MIELVNGGRFESTINFTPRSRYRGQVEDVKCDLISGHTCPSCGNVIDAVFHTKKEIDIEKYEETVIYSQKDDMNDSILRIVPGFENGTNYRSQFYQTSTGNGQRIVLGNHTINWKGLSNGNREEFWDKEQGFERPCMYNALISLRTEDLINELSLFCGTSFSSRDRQNKEPVSLEFFEDWLKKEFYSTTKGMRVVRAIGDGIPGILVKREMMKLGSSITISSLLNKWDAQKAAEEVEKIW